MGTAGQRRHRDVALPGAVQGPREHRVELLPPPCLAGLHARLRPHHRHKPVAAAGGGVRRKPRPENRCPGLLHLRPGLPAHTPAHSGPTLTENDRGPPDQPGMLPSPPDRSPAHRTRPRQLRPLRPGPPERLAGLEERPAALRAEDHRVAAHYRQRVPDLRLPRRHHTRRAQPVRWRPTGTSQREEADRVPHQTPDTGRARRLHRPAPRHHAGTRRS